MKEFIKPEIEIIEIENDEIILCSPEQYGPDIPVVEPDDPGFWD